MRQAAQYKNKLIGFTIASIAFMALVMSPSAVSPAYAAPTECLEASCPSASSSTAKNTAVAGQAYCGDGDQKVKISFDIGCKGVGGGVENPITDAVFAIIRFLTTGVGLVIVASLTIAGIQYTTSRGDPKATAEAIGRLKSNMVAFLLFLFGFALLNYIIPKGFIGL